MTIEQICECDAATLEAMDNETLKKHFEKYFPITRPDLAPRPLKSNSSSPVKPTLTPQQIKAKELAKQLGIELPMFSSSLGRKK